MAVRDTINSIKQHIEDAYGIAEEKQAVIPEQKNLANLADCVASISGSEDLDTELYDYKNGLDTEDIKIEDIINAVQGKAGKKVPEVKEKDIIFIDYDGTLLHSYTIDEIKTLEELPEGPTHEGLVFQEWNWTLDELKEHDMPMTVGATYTTDDESNRIYIELEERLDPYLGFAVNGTVQVDWGDGTNERIVGTSSTTTIYTQHIYPSSGEYVIKLKSNSTIIITGSNAYGSNLITNQKSNNERLVYCGMIKKVELNNMKLDGYAFHKCYELESIALNNKSLETKDQSGYNYYLFALCYSLKTVIIPRLVKVFGNMFCQTNRNLKYISFPRNLHYQGQSSFINCNYLKRIDFPKYIKNSAYDSFTYGYSIKQLNIHFIDTNAGTRFQYFYNLKKVILNNVDIVNNMFMSASILETIVVKNNIATIGSQAFYNCYGLKKLDLTECTSVPSLPYIDAFSNTNDNYKIVVPDNLYDEWITTTNWSNATIVSHIVKESEYNG